MRLFKVTPIDMVEFVILMLFQDAPKWEALNRGVETDRHPIRTGYLKNIGL